MYLGEGAISLLKERLLSKVVVADSGCWEWTGSRSHGRYGSIHFGGRILVAHRASYQVFMGEIGDGLNVCHKCDNPKCINPEHLFLGTQKDNMHDCSIKGRVHRHLGNENYMHTHPDTFLGEKNGRAKLTALQVTQIRSEYSDDKSRGSIQRLANKYAVNWSQIKRIVTYEHWR